jgi:hypothetical protein
MPAPSKYPDWATDGTNVVEPPAGKVAAGWLPAEQPPAGWFNAWQALVGQWTRWLDGRIAALQGDIDAIDTTLDSTVAHKNQSNVFTQPQTISGVGGVVLNVVGGEIAASGSITTSLGSVEANGPGSNVVAASDMIAGHDVTAVHDVDAGHNMHADTDVYVDKGDYKYKTPKTRTTFVPIFSGSGGAVFNGGSGDQLGGHAGYNLKFSVANAEHTFPICLPHGAVLTGFAVLVWKAGTGTMYAELNKRTNHNFELIGAPPVRTIDQTSLAKPQMGALVGPAVVAAGGLTVTFDNRAEDAANGSEYLLSVIAGNANDEIHAVRLTWTDPGPRNF